MEERPIIIWSASLALRPPTLVAPAWRGCGGRVRLRARVGLRGKVRERVRVRVTGSVEGYGTGPG